MKRNLLMILTILITFFTFDVYADEVIYTNTTRTQVVYRYTIEKYDVNINVRDDNVLEITESITANFKDERHGIVRRIPLKNVIKRVDGSTHKNYVRITDLDVSEEYTARNQSGYRVIRVGNEELLTGSHDYVIKYNYNLGRDLSKNFDELYFNIIGDEWDTEINNVTFTINMPEDFDRSKLGFSTGKYGAEGSNIVEYTVDGLSISGSLSEKLDREEALTIRLELPEGYFANASSNFSWSYALVLIVPVLCAVITYLMWRKLRKNKI